MLRATSASPLGAADDGGRIQRIQSYLAQQARRRVVGAKDTVAKATGRLEIQVVGDIDTVAKTSKREATELTDAAAQLTNRPPSE